jgi:hypothetical protein
VVGSDRVVVLGEQAVGFVGEYRDAEEEGVGDFDASQCAVLGDASEACGEDLMGSPVGVVAGFVDGGDEGGPGGGVLEVVGASIADEFGQDGAPGRGE